jgi:PPIC-type PPIASE domain
VSGVGRARRPAVVVSALLLAVAASCRPKPSGPSPDTIALIDSEPLLLGSFRSDFEASVGRPIAASSPRVASSVFDQYLNEHILCREARKILKSGSLDCREAPAILLRTAGPSVQPTDEAIRQEYAAHPDRYRVEEEVRARTIETSDLATAQRARQRLRSGESFPTVAREMSNAPDAFRGGDIGPIRHGDLPAEYEKVLFALKPGEVSPILPETEGYRIFQLTERTPARSLSLQEARPAIEKRLAQGLANRYLDAIVGRYVREGMVTVLADHLPFPYDGKFPSRREF